MKFHPNPIYQPIPVKAVIPKSLRTRSQRINPWIPADQPAATMCNSEGGYKLKEGEIKPTWQMYRVLTGQEKKNHFGLIKLDPEKPSPTILSGTGGTTTGLIHPWEIRKPTIDEVKALASYPERFQFVGSYHERWARIGDSVPPLMMKSISENVRCQFLDGHASTSRLQCIDRCQRNDALVRNCT